MSFSEEEKKRIMAERAIQMVSENLEDRNIRDDITDVVENTIGACTASKEIIQNVLLTIENHYGEIEV